MQTCYNCGKTVSDETLICPDCGALVKRYTSPPVREEAAPVMQQAPVPEQNQSQRVRLYGGVKVWLILLSVLAGYFCFSSLCAVFYALNADALRDMFAQPGMEALAPMMEEMLDMLPQMLPVFAVMAIVCALKLFCHIWLLVSGRKLAFYFDIGTGVLSLLLLLIGGSLLSFFFVIEPLMTWLLLKRFWPWMQK